MMKSSMATGTAAAAMLATTLFAFESASWAVSDDELDKVGSRKWIEVSTPNFDVLTTMSSEEAGEIALELERFRAVIARFTNAPPIESPIPTRIFAFARASDFQVFTDRRETAGWFRSGMRHNVIALRSGSNRTSGSTSRFILHEYVHFVLRNASEIAYPHWYSEGFAEYLSTVAVHEGEVLVLGGVPRDRMDELRYVKWLSLRKIIPMRGNEKLAVRKRALFYAEAWALVHYLHQGREGAHDLPSEIATYLERIEQGDSEKDAFEKAFGETIRKTDYKVRKYLTKSGRLEAIALPLSVLDYTPPVPQVRGVTRDEISTKLGQLALSLGMVPAAQRYFATAVEVNPENSRAQAGLGDAYKFQNRWDDAAPHFERAISLGPDDAYNHLDLAEFTHDQAINVSDADKRSEFLSLAREQYAKSRALDPEIPEVYAMYGSTYLPEGQDGAKSIKLIEHANRMLPANDQIITLLAMAYLRNDRTDDARKLVQRKMHRAHGGAIDGDVDEVLDRLREALEFKPQKQDD